MKSLLKSAVKNGGITLPCSEIELIDMLNSACDYFWVQYKSKRKVLIEGEGACF